MLHFLSSQWEEIGNGVWVNPIRLRVAQKYTKSKTAGPDVFLQERGAKGQKAP